MLVRSMVLRISRVFTNSKGIKKHDSCDPGILCMGSENVTAATRDIVSPKCLHLHLFPRKPACSRPLSSAKNAASTIYRSGNRTWGTMTPLVKDSFVSCLDRVSLVCQLKARMADRTASAPTRHRCAHRGGGLTALPRDKTDVLTYRAVGWHCALVQGAIRASRNQSVLLRESFRPVCQPLSQPSAPGLQNRPLRRLI